MTNPAGTAGNNGPSISGGNEQSSVLADAPPPSNFDQVWDILGSGKFGQTLMMLSDTPFDFGWVTRAQSALFYFLYNTASDIPTYYQMLTATNTGALQQITKAGVTNGTLLAAFATDPGIPALDFMPAGISKLHIHAHQTAGTKTSQLYYSMYKRNLAGVETLIATSSFTAILQGSDAGYDCDAQVPFTLLDVTDRIVMKVFAQVTGNGNNPTIELDMGDNTTSRFEIPYAG